MKPAVGGQEAPKRGSESFFLVSNSRKKTQILRPLGIDRISAVVPVDSIDPDSPIWVKKSRTTYDEKVAYQFEGQLPISDQNAVYVSARWGVGQLPSIRLDFNPSRVVYPDTYGLATVDEAVAVTGDVVSLLDSFAEGAPPREGINLTRVDVARDFAVGDDLSPVIRSLANAPRPYARSNSFYTNPETNSAETFTAGNKSGLIRCYDKHAENENAPEGTLRVEIQARKSWLRRFGDIRSLDQLTDERVGKLATNRWEWSCVGVPIVARKALHDKVSALPLSAAVRSQLFAFVVLQSQGIDLGLSPNSTRHYRALQKKFGLIASVDQNSSDTISLQLTTGEVVRG